MQVQAAVMLQPGQIEIREFEKPSLADDALLFTGRSSRHLWN